MNYVLNDEEMNYILALLAERPYRESAELIEKIHEQYKQNKEDKEK